MRSTMKRLLGTLLAISIFAGVALAFSDYKTRFIISSTLTIHVKEGRYIVIRNFTQDKNVGQRGVIVAGVIPSTPTPTPTPTPSPTPVPTPTPNSFDLTATKSHNPSGNITSQNPSWTWTIHVANGGGTDANFSGQDILRDNLPNNSNITYTQPSNPVTNQVNITGGNSISCTISNSDLFCSALNNVTIGAGGSFDVSFTATATAGTYANPRGGGNCKVDPDNDVTEANENNNTCADTVVANLPNPTPTPIFAGVLTAAITSLSPKEYIKPIIVAGPATLTIDPIPGATLAITYKKYVQPIQPTPTSTVTAAKSSTSSTFSASTSTKTSTTTHSGTVSRSIVSDEDEIEWSTPSRTPTPTATPTPTPAPKSRVSTAAPTPTATASVSPTPTP